MESHSLIWHVIAGVLIGAILCFMYWMMYRMYRESGLVMRDHLEHISKLKSELDESHERAGNAEANLARMIEVCSTLRLKTEAPYPNQDWIDHAYPLQQLTIRLQGTKHSDRAAVINQLQKVIKRLDAGEQTGQEQDDDFGYSFEYIRESSGPSFFNE